MDAYANEVKRKLVKLSYKAGLLFAACTCDQLYPNYLSFHKAVNWGDPKVLRESIDTIYQYAIDETLYDQKDFQNLITAVDLVTPDLDDFPGIRTSFALDACTAVSDSLDYLLNKSHDKLAFVAISARDTVDMFIQARDNLDSHDQSIEGKIGNDPLMIYEKLRQNDLIERLSSMTSIEVTDSLIKDLRDIKPIINLNSID